MNRTMNLAMRQYFADNDGAGGGGGSNDGGGAGGGEALTFETWHGSLGDDHKKLIDSHVGGLKSALESERTEKRELSKQLAQLSAKAAKGENVEKELGEVNSRLETTQKRADFYESAHSAGIKNLKAAWLIASGDEGVWKRDGTLDLEAFKGSYPELFGSVQVPPGNGGNGNGQGGGGATSMDQAIRQAARGSRM
jgi:hypothetical protein